ncbi:MAG: PEP-CTERM sorting domain-containing protein [Betaproteobacteria bacterium]|nr:MAG: PEP-CTERM sorting domain-containing protein [Betaproteobacteria bacterium]
MRLQLMRYCRAIVLFAALGAAAPVHSGLIPLNTFLAFSFGSAGTAANGCDPADPAGGFCLTSNPLLDAPPWTFLAPLSGAMLTIVDGFLAGDRFQIFDFGVLIGLTSAPGTGDCGDDPVACLANPGMSQAVFMLLAGQHSITIVPILSPFDGGVGFLQVRAEAQAVPEPSSLMLLGGGLLAPYLWRKRRKGSSTYISLKVGRSS